MRSIRRSDQVFVGSAYLYLNRHYYNFNSYFSSRHGIERTRGYFCKMIERQTVFKNYFPNYLGVMKGVRLAKYLIAKKVKVDITKGENFTLKQLWDLHDTAKRNFQELYLSLANKPLEFQDLPKPSFSYLDLKSLLAQIAPATQSFFPFMYFVIL